MRCFVLLRYLDRTGVSGTGIVAEGVQFGDGRVAMRWLTNGVHGVVLHESIEDVMRIHGHDGATRVRWLDEGAPLVHESDECVLRRLG